MKFEIINPPNPYTMEADDLEVAAVAVCLLGDGRYGLDAQGIDADTGADVPIFLLGGHDDWFTSRFGADYESTARRVLNHRNDALARALESVTLGRAERSSLNDIGGRAKTLARAVRVSGEDVEERG